MAYKVEKLVAEPILIATIGEAFDMRQDTIPYITELKAALDGPETLYFITDARNIHITFGDMVASLGTMSRGDLNITLLLRRHKVLFVVNNRLAKLGASAMSQAQYGGIDGHIFESLESALEYARMQLANVSAAVA